MPAGIGKLTSYAVLRKFLKLRSRLLRLQHFTQQLVQTLKNGNILLEPTFGGGDGFAPPPSPLKEFQRALMSHDACAMCTSSSKNSKLNLKLKKMPNSRLCDVRIFVRHSLLAPSGKKNLHVNMCTCQHKIADIGITWKFCEQNIRGILSENSI